MAEKPELNKSEAIRDYYKSNPTAKTKEVVDALAKQGITVTTGLVTNVKSTHNKRQAAKKAAKATAKTPASSTAVAATLAKKSGMNKSQAIRDYLTANKKAKAQEVVDALAKQGIETTANYVMNLKSKRKTRRKAVEQVVSEGVVGIPEIKAAFAFLKAVGSVAMAKEALAAAVEIKKIV